MSCLCRQLQQQLPLNFQHHKLPLESSFTGRAAITWQFLTDLHLVAEWWTFTTVSAAAGVRMQMHSLAYG